MQYPLLPLAVPGLQLGTHASDHLDELRCPALRAQAAQPVADPFEEPSQSLQILQTLPLGTGAQLLHALLLLLRQPRL